ncbi:LPS translocon maturation chaperone LptM [Rubrivivax sp. RP6-9]
MPSTLTLALVLGTAGLLAGCGQKGPLVLPAPAAAASAPAR